MYIHVQSHTSLIEESSLLVVQRALAFAGANAFVGDPTVKNRSPKKWWISSHGKTSWIVIYQWVFFKS